MNRNDKIKALEEAKRELEDLKELQKNDPATAKIVAKAALIKTGVLNEDGSSKEEIVTESHIGYFEDNDISYEEIVNTMRDCMDGLRNLGDGDREKTRNFIKKALIDSGFVDKMGHLLVREKRAPHVEAFFKRVEAERRALEKQKNKNR